MGEVTDTEFTAIQRWLYQRTGIHLNSGKKNLINGRLSKRLRQLDLSSMSDYARILLEAKDEMEQQIAINLLTTNETYFFREPKHFSFLAQQIIPDWQKGKEYKVWSAAASSGQEAYTIAMVLAKHLGMDAPWKIIGTDINSEVLAFGARAIYPMQAAARVPQEFLKRYCQKGKGKDEGWFRIGPELRKKVEFQQLNLMSQDAWAPKFDLIFLRNVLIYFEVDDKKKIVQRVLKQLKPGGWLLMGHSESIYGYDPRLAQRSVGCYQFEVK